MRVRLAELWLLMTDPGEWSARRYARKNSMELTALHPEKWREPARYGGRDHAAGRSPLRPDEGPA